MHLAPVAVIVVECIVLLAPTVSKRNGVPFPAELAGELRPPGVFFQKSQKRTALFFGHAVETLNGYGADIQRFASGLGMRADDWMDHFLLGIFLYLHIHRLAKIFLPQRHLAITGPIGSLPGMHGFHVGQQILRGIQERFVGALHVDKNCVSARFRYIQGV